jgi:hypothetical protein
MKGRMFKLLAVGLSVIAFSVSAYPSHLVIDHTCTDLSLIPDQWIDSVQANVRLHYAHTSHGGQLTTGLSRIETADSKYDVTRASGSLPTTPGALCIFDGQEGVTYITPELYWQTAAGMDSTRAVLNHNPTINVSMWSWCCQLTSYTQAQTQAYLDSMTVLEGEYPGVTFIYMTCNAQYTGSQGYNRYLRNQQIRQYCEANENVLFDFADLDAWWYNPDSLRWEFASYQYSDSTVPVEHSQFNVNEAGHTTFESCEQKGKAVWWMMARLAGWSGVSVEEGSNYQLSTGNRQLSIHPNPFTHNAVVEFGGRFAPPAAGLLHVYDLGGRLVQETGGNTVGKGLEPGIYFVKVRGHEPVKIVKLK